MNMVQLTNLANLAGAGLGLVVLVCMASLALTLIILNYTAKIHRRVRDLLESESGGIHELVRLMEIVRRDMHEILEIEWSRRSAAQERDRIRERLGMERIERGERGERVSRGHYPATTTTSPASLASPASPALPSPIPLALVEIHDRQGNCVGKAPRDSATAKWVIDNPASGFRLMDPAGQQTGDMQ